MKLHEICESHLSDDIEKVKKSYEQACTWSPEMLNALTWLVLYPTKIQAGVNYSDLSVSIGENGPQNRGIFDNSASIPCEVLPG